MTRRYLLSLTLLTLLLALASFCLLWFAPERFHSILPAIALYFAVVTGVQHYVVVRAALKDPRTFIKVFLGLTVGVLFLHLIVLIVYMFSHLHQPSLTRMFLIAFCIGYAVYLAFETTALVMLVRKK